MTDPADFDFTRSTFHHVHLRVADLARSKAFYEHGNNIEAVSNAPA